MKRFREKPFERLRRQYLYCRQSGKRCGRHQTKPTIRGFVPKRSSRREGLKKENRPFFTKTEGGLSSLSKGAPAGGRPEYEVGDRVKHIKYREGTVLKIEEGARDFQVTVEFDGAGTKVMYAAFCQTAENCKAAIVFAHPDILKSKQKLPHSLFEPKEKRKIKFSYSKKIENGDII